MSDTDRLGLTDDEVTWLRQNRATDPTAKLLVSLYNMVRAAPQDNGARGLFAATLDDWRIEKRRMAN